jgi:hypothetical protein
VGPLPDSLRGVWEKIDQPFGGMRVEFAAETGMAAVKVVAAPLDDAAAAAFYAQKKGGEDAAQGARTAACMSRIWAAGKTKYKELRPTARGDEWVGSAEFAVIRLETCSVMGMKQEDAVLRQKSQDELVATIVTPKVKKVRTETWRRVKP